MVTVTPLAFCILNHLIFRISFLGGCPMYTTNCNVCGGKALAEFFWLLITDNLIS